MVATLFENGKKSDSEGGLDNDIGRPSLTYVYKNTLTTPA